MCVCVRACVLWCELLTFRLDDMASSNGCQTAMSCLAPSQVASRTLTCKSRHDIAVLECDSVRCRSRHSRNHRLGFESGHHSPAATERRKVGGGRAWFLHQFAFPAMLLILACLATSSQGTPLPLSRVSALRTAETGEFQNCFRSDEHSILNFHQTVIASHSCYHHWDSVFELESYLPNCHVKKDGIRRRW